MPRSPSAVPVDVKALRILKAEPDPAPTAQEYHCTDLGNAERLVARHGENLLYCGPRDCWFLWNGRCWKLDEGREVDRLANETIRAAFAEASGIDDPLQRRDFIKHLFKSEQHGALVAMVARAKSIAQRCKPDGLDANPMLLNCLNGTVNLQTGCLYRHDRNQLLTKLAGTEYHPEAKCPMFERFVHRIMGATADASEGELGRADRMVRYLQKSLGYAATGSVREKNAFVLHGPKDTGKTTLLEIIRVVLGDYAGQILIDSLMTKQLDNGTNTDLADLCGCRFVSTSECNQGQRLNVARLKYLTGTGRLKARRLGENCFEFNPTHKLFLDSNDLPEIRGADDAIFGRLHCIPFVYVIPQAEQDKALLDKVIDQEAAGVLTWIITGTQSWLAEGLDRPSQVQAATDDYQKESDPLREFLEDCCRIGSDQWVGWGQLWTAYTGWCERTREKYPLPKRTFRVELRHHKFEPEKCGIRGWRGLDLKS